MLRSEPMQKVMVVCLDKDRRVVVSTLHRIGIIDLRKSKLQLSDDAHAENFTVLSDMQIRLAGALSLLKKPKSMKRGTKIQRERQVSADALPSAFAGNRAIERIYELDEQRKRANNAIRQLEQTEAVAMQLSGINVDVDGLKSDLLSFKAYSAANEKEIASIKTEIEKKRLAMEAIESGKKGQFSLILAYKRGIDVDSMARAHSLKELDISHITGKPADALARIQKDKASEEKTIKDAEAELGRISNAEYLKLSAMMEMIKIEMAKASVSEIFKRTDSAIVIEGWVPKKRRGELDSTLDKATSGRYHIENLATDELAPTLSSKPGFMKPFDYMIGFISVPRSDEIDPSLFFMLSFPIFYGLMISDVGYGIASFIFAWYITRITDPEGLVYNTAKIWQFSAISAIFFGFLSNQYFGLPLNQYFTSFVGFDWFKSITTIILVSVIFGLLQVVVGLMLGFVNNYRHHRKLAFGRLSSIALVLSGTVAVAGGLFNLVSSTVTLAAAGVAIASLVITMVLSGEEAGEVTSLISHPLSYVRLMGFGLAGVVLAFLIDQAFTPKLSAGIPFFLLSMVLFIVLHFLNMIVSMFEGAVQGARLNLIEFFTKFYKGGGVRYEPFSSKRIYTKE